MKTVTKIFKSKKILPLDKFIEEALYNKEYGYYSIKNPFGAKNDFVTAPLISELFGEIVGIWCIGFWEKLGKPNNLNIVELGPGEGSLCLTLIRVFSKFRAFNNIVKINLLEKSKILKNLQKKKITYTKVRWINNINKINNGPIILIANEFFDALPIKQFFLRDKIWYERFVKYITKKKIIFSKKKVNSKNLNQLFKQNFIKGQNFVELPVQEIRYLKSISKIINKYNGGMICFDYGYVSNKMFDSLQSVQRHNYSEVLKNVGKSDITHLVNFSLFSKIIKKLNLSVEKITNQNTFLQKMGIIQRANILTKNINFKAKADFYYQLKRLLDKNEMGELFKVIFFKKKGIKFNLGFK